MLPRGPGEELSPWKYFPDPGGSCELLCGDSPVTGRRCRWWVTHPTVARLVGKLFSPQGWEVSCTSKGRRVPSQQLSPVHGGDLVGCGVG